MVVERGAIRFLPNVSLQEVSSVPLVYPRLLIQGPLQRVTNSYLRCKHEVQLVSGPDYQAFLVSSDFVSTARGTSEHCVGETFSRRKLTNSLDFV